MTQSASPWAAADIVPMKCSLAHMLLSMQPMGQEFHSLCMLPPPSNSPRHLTGGHTSCLLHMQTVFTAANRVCAVATANTVCIYWPSPWLHPCSADAMHRARLDCGGPGNFVWMESFREPSESLVAAPLYTLSLVFHWRPYRCPGIK